MGIGSGGELWGGGKWVGEWGSGSTIWGSGSVWGGISGEGGGGMEWNFRPNFFLRDPEVRRILLRSCGVGSAVLDVSRISDEVPRRNAAAASACG